MDANKVSNFNQWVKDMEEKLSPLGLKPLMTKRPGGEVWGLECRYCGEFWATFKKAQHTKTCKNPNIQLRHIANEEYL